MPWRHQFWMIASEALRPAGCSRRKAPRRVAIELRAIGRELRLEIVEHFLGKAARIGRRLHHQRRHRADDRRLGHPALAVPRQITHHLAAAGGMADVDGVLQIEMRRHGRKVVGIMIHVVAVALWLDRPWPRRSCAMTR